MKQLGYGKDYSYNPGFAHPVHNVSPILLRIANTDQLTAMTVAIWFPGIYPGEFGRVFNFWQRESIANARRVRKAGR
jgi:hypothetical protein